MPPNVDVLYRFTVTWSLLGQLCQNVFHLRGKETDPSASLDAALDALQGQLHANWSLFVKDRMSNQCSLVEEKLEILDPPVSPFRITDYTGIVGAVASPSLPSFNAAVISWQTGLSGRRLHGRTYIPGIAEQYVSGNDLTDGALSQFNQVKDQYLTFFGFDGASQVAWGVVYSRKNGDTRDPGPPPTIHHSVLMGVPIKYGLARRTIYTNRHRLEGRGM